MRRSDRGCCRLAGVDAAVCRRLRSELAQEKLRAEDNNGHRQNYEQEALLVAGLGLRALVFGHGLSGFLVWGCSSTPALEFHVRPSCAGLEGRPYMNPVTGRDRIRPSRTDGNAEGDAAPWLIRATRRGVQQLRRHIRNRLVGSGKRARTLVRSPICIRGAR